MTHNVLRLLARHGCALVAIGEAAVRFYTAPPLLPDSSTLARAQVTRWADPKQRMEVACDLYVMGFGEIVPTRDITMLRGQEGVRIKRAYVLAAERHGIPWSDRRYDRKNPEGGDLANQAVNHAGSAMTAAGSAAVPATDAIPQLGFVHEGSSQSYVIDIGDLYRQDVLLDVAFGAVKEARARGAAPVERLVRQREAIPGMIDRINALLMPAAGTEAGTPGASASDGAADGGIVAPASVVPRRAATRPGIITADVRSADGNSVPRLALAGAAASGVPVRGFVQTIAVPRRGRPSKPIVAS